VRFSDQHFIVTGSTTGIGKAIAKALLAEGASVLLHGLEPELGQATRAELDPDGERSELLICDLAEADAPERIVNTALERFGSLHGLINNAAAVIFSTLAETDPALFDKILAVNTRAPLFLIKAALPHLERTHGSVVNIGSVNAYSGEPGLVPYAISKGALMTMTRNLGDTLHRDHGVRVNQVNPGWVLTENEKQRKQDQGMPDDWPAQQPKLFVPAGRLIAPAEIAAAVLYFLSADAGPVSGSVLDVEQHPFIGRNPPKC